MRRVASHQHCAFGLAGATLKGTFLRVLQDTGVLSQKIEAKGMQEMMMTNPDFMQGMMKQQLGGLLPQVGSDLHIGSFWRLALPL